MNGEYDSISQLVTMQLSLKRKQKKASTVHGNRLSGTIGLRFNFINGGTSGLMSNVKIRKAISYSIDREEMIDAVYGRYNPAYSYVAPAITFNGSSYRSQVGEVIEDEYNEYVGDPDKIVALFQEGLDELGVETPSKISH